MAISYSHENKVQKYPLDLYLMGMPEEDER